MAEGYWYEENLTNPSPDNEVPVSVPPVVEEKRMEH